MLAEFAVLTAESKNVPPEIPPQLSSLCGVQKAESLLAEAQANRAPGVKARSERLKTLRLNVDAAQVSMTINRARLPDFGKGIDVRQDRLASLEKLASHGDVMKVTMDQVLGDLLDAQDRRESLIATVHEDEHRIATAQNEVASFTAETESDLSLEIDRHQREIDELTPEVTADHGIVSLMKPDAGGDVLRFEIIRNGQLLPADMTTLVRPGDVLRVETTNPQGLEANQGGIKDFKRLSEAH